MTDCTWESMTWQDEDRLIRQIAHKLSGKLPATRAHHRDAAMMLKEIDARGWVLLRRAAPEGTERDEP